MLAWRRSPFLLSFLILALSQPAAGEGTAEPQPDGKGAAPVRTDRYGDSLPAGAVTRIGTTRFRHDDYVRSAAISPDGKLIASCGDEGTVRLWDAATGKELHRFPAMTHGVFASVAFSANGKILAAGGFGGDDGSVQLFAWDLAAAKYLWQLKRPDARDPWAIAFSPDGKLLAAGNTLREATTGKPIRQLAGDNVQSLAFSPKGNILAAGGPKRITLWNPATGEELRQFGGPVGGYRSIAFAPDGKTLAAGAAGWSGELQPPVRLWEVATGNELRKFAGYHAVAFSPDGKLATGGDKGVAATVWEPSSGKQLQQFTWDYPRGGLPRAFSGDGRFLVVAMNRSLHLWDVPAGKQMLAFPGHVDAVTQLVISRDGRTLTSASFDGTIRTWEIATGNELRHIQGRWGGLSADGKKVATLGERKPALWDMTTGKQLREFGPEGYSFQYSCLSLDGTLLAVRSLNNTDIWEAATGKKGRQFKESGKPVAFSPDGNLLAVTWYRRVSLWNVIDGTEQPLFGKTDLRPPPSWHPPAVAFSQDGKTLATADSNTIALWEPATGKLRLKWDGANKRGFVEVAILSIAISPDHRTVATGYADGAIHLWDAATGKERGRFSGHDTRTAADRDRSMALRNRVQVQALVFSADGRFLISGSQDTTIVVWDVKSVNQGGR